jgi:hypothetical protein
MPANVPFGSSRIGCRLPRTISFKGAIQTLEAFQLVIEHRAAHGAAHRLRLYQDLLNAITTHRVATVLTVSSLA